MSEADTKIHITYSHPYDTRVLKATLDVGAMTVNFISDGDEFNDFRSVLIQSDGKLYTQCRCGSDDHLQLLPGEFQEAYDAYWFGVKHVW
jgi:hypothetical protein